MQLEISVFLKFETLSWWRYSVPPLTNCVVCFLLVSHFLPNWRRLQISRDCNYLMADQNHPLRLYDWKERRKVSGENKDKALQINIYTRLSFNTNEISFQNFVWLHYNMLYLSRNSTRIHPCIWQLKLSKSRKGVVLSSPHTHKSCVENLPSRGWLMTNRTICTSCSSLTISSCSS